MYRPLWAEVDLGRLRKNLKVIKRVVGSRVGIIATVKQSAYGHGLVPVAKELAEEGVSFFGVGSIEEAVSLRENGISQSVLVLTAVLPEFAGCFVEHTITPTVVDLSFAEALNAAARKAGKIHPVHIKIDTGMGRLGLSYQDTYPFVKQVNALENIFLEGLYTHFPAADTDMDFTNYQISKFNEFISKLEKEGIKFKFYHCANSIGVANYPNSHFNMVRPGLILYGLKPAANMDLDVQAILSLKSKIVFIKKIDKGATVSYGRSYVTNKPTYIATVAAGYADGYPWNLSNHTCVIIKDSIFPLAGRVCMDHIMVDIGDRQDIKAGDEVILIGKKNNLKIDVSTLAQWAGTIPYEIISRLSQSIPRVYKNESIRI